MMMASFELIVTDTGEYRFLRVYAWFKLVRLWASLRGDDIQGILPQSLKPKARLGTRTQRMWEQLEMAYRRLAEIGMLDADSNSAVSLL